MLGSGYESDDGLGAEREAIRRSAPISSGEWAPRIVALMRPRKKAAYAGLRRSAGQAGLSAGCL